MGHTILLIQKNKTKSTRTFTDHETTTHALEHVIQMYETRLKELNPDVRNITYDIRDLNDYIDRLGELCALVFNPQVQAYVPYDKEWLKSKIFNHLQMAAKQV